jgi:predicted DNA-binding protein with PD1-like motif
MIFLTFSTVKRPKYRIQVVKGEDLLKTLDKFLKKNKIKVASIKNWSISFFEEKSITSQRISRSIFHALKF